MTARQLFEALRARVRSPEGNEPVSRKATLGLFADLGCLSLCEVSDASALAGNLFRQAFKVDIPRTPRHFVLIRRTASNSPLVLGYVHFTEAGSAYLAGGLVVSAMEFRRLDKETAELVRGQGGLAEWTMRTACGWLSDTDAVFACIGDNKSLYVNLRIGFMPTGQEYLHVLWKRHLDETSRQALIARVASMGLF